MKNKKKNTIMFLIILILGLTIGFAILTQTLKIDGTGLVKGNSWDIHWANPEVIDGSASDVIPTLSNSNTLATYEIDLYNPGDYYEFTIDAVNAGTLDAEILKLDNNFYNSSDEEIDLPNYLKSTITNIDGTSIEKGQRLNSQESKKYKVRVDYRDDVDSSELPSTDETITGKISIEYIQADVKVEAVSFAKDPWDVIADCAKLGTCPYEVGDTKVIDLGSFGKHTLRIANMSTPNECSQKGFSQTACGFVLEFADVITTHYMNENAPDWQDAMGDGSIGGWPICAMRTYINEDIYNAFPTKLKNAISSTYVVSSHQADTSSYTKETEDYTTSDKLYLLSQREVWGDIESDYYDKETAYEKTRQLDYYQEKGVTRTNYSDAAKKLGENAVSVWLRSASSGDRYSFQDIYETGNRDKTTCNRLYGVSPAFKLG